MSITLKQQQVNVYLETVLKSFKDGQIDALKARNDLAQVLTMAAIDNERDLLPYMTAESFKARWAIS